MLCVTWQFSKTSVQQESSKLSWKCQTKGSGNNNSLDNFKSFNTNISAPYPSRTSLWRLPSLSLGAWVLSHVQLFMTSWTGTHPTPLSMRFSRQEYWSGLPFPPPGDISHPGIKPSLLRLLDYKWTLIAEPPGKPSTIKVSRNKNQPLRKSLNTMEGLKILSNSVNFHNKQYYRIKSLLNLLKLINHRSYIM